MDKEVVEAVVELAGYYGMVSGDEYIKKIYNGGSGFSATTEALEAALKNDDVADKFTSEAKTFSPLKNIVESVKDAADKQKQIAITPDNDAYGITDTDLLNVPNIDQGKGKPSNGKSYTVNDFRSKDTKTEGDFNPPPVHVIQVFKAESAPTAVNTEIVALWLNSIPVLEMSRAVPYLDVRIIPRGAAQGGPRPLSLDRFLLGTSGFENASNDAKNLVNSSYLTDPIQGQRSDVTDVKKTNSEIASAMEIFTSPQTMIGARSSQNSDKFRPFMSFNSLDVSEVPGGGMMSFKTAKMDLLLHDRTRLREALALVAPGATGKTQIEITYGWSHPQNNSLSRPADSAVNNRFAKLINAMRVTQVFNVVNSEYSFNDSGEVELGVKLALAGVNAAANTEVTYTEVGNREKELDKVFKEISSIMSRLRSSDPDGKLTFPNYISSATNLGGAALSMRKSIYKVRQKIKDYKKNKDPDFKALAQELDKVFGKSRGKGQLNALTKSKKQVLAAMIKNLKATPDPFLPHTGVGNVSKRDLGVSSKGSINSKKQKYVSLGKLITNFVADAFDKSDYSEIQLLFYPVNESASYANTLNLAQFPIELGDLETIITQRFDVTQKLTVGSFLRVLNGFFLRDMGSEVYGMNGLFGKRTKGDNKKFTTKRKRNNSYKKSDKFRAKKLEILRTAYGKKGDTAASGLNFRMPQVTIKYEVCPTNAEGDVSPILKMHFMDQACGKAEQLKDALMAFGGDGVFTKLDRKSEDNLKVNGKDVRVPGHGENIEKQLTKLVEIGLCKKAKDDKDIVDQLKGFSQESVEELLEGIYVLSPNSAPEGDSSGKQGDSTANSASAGFNAIATFKSLFPSVTYGAANGNMIEADLQTVSDSAMNTVLMLAGNSSDADKGDVGVDTGMPLQIMPTQLSIKTTGCPYVAFGQQLFIDFGTNTTADNFYAVTGIQHKIGPGEFNTDINMVQLDGFGTFRSALDAKARTSVVMALAAKRIEAEG